MKRIRQMKHYIGESKKFNVKLMICKYGFGGYGVYWIIREILCDQKDLKLKLNDMTIKLIAFDIHESEDYVRDFISDCVNEFKLFQKDGEYLKDDSLKLMRSMAHEGTRPIVDNMTWRMAKKDVFERDKYTCTYCGTTEGKMEVDHVIPRSKGGTDDLDNLATACKSCNRQKGSKTLEEFLEYKKSKE